MKNAAETDSSTSTKKPTHVSDQLEGPPQLRWLEGIDTAGRYPEFKDAWLRYCVFCRAPRDVLDELLGPEYKPPGSPVSHVSILAYAAAMKGDPELAAKAGKGLISTGKNGEASLKTQKIEGPDVLSIQSTKQLG